MVPSGWMTPDTACTIRPSCSTAIMPCSSGPGGTASGGCVWIKIGNGKSLQESPGWTAPVSHDHQDIRAPPVRGNVRLPHVFPGFIVKESAPLGKRKTSPIGEDV